MAFYVLDENNNKVEALDKEGVLAVLAQAIADGSLENVTADAAFISKVKCCVSGETHKMAFITQTKYNELVAAGKLQENTYYFITDDTSYEDLDEALNKINAELTSLDKRATALENKGFKLKASNITSKYLTYTQTIYTVLNGEETGKTTSTQEVGFVFLKEDMPILSAGKYYLITVGGNTDARTFIVNGEKSTYVAYSNGNQYWRTGSVSIGTTELNGWTTVVSKVKVDDTEYDSGTFAYFNLGEYTTKSYGGPKILSIYEIAM